MQVRAPRTLRRVWNTQWALNVHLYKDKGRTEEVSGSVELISSRFM